MEEKEKMTLDEWRRVGEFLLEEVAPMLGLTGVVEGQALLEEVDSLGEGIEELMEKEGLLREQLTISEDREGRSPLAMVRKMAEKMSRSTERQRIRELKEEVVRERGYADKYSKEYTPLLDELL
ncbi:hypothetical protein BGX38DRAFT_1280901 [Terfezia claveryi]|nr:hypothetical protein BGX38DRAFT_1280901 [Terfezia claveryi]